LAELIVALDHAEAADAFALLDRLPGRVRVKVGSALFTRAGPGFVRALIDQGHAVFLDLKWHDIPNTVAAAVSAAAALGVEMATVHATGGRAMLDAAVEAASGRITLVAVTVLTSHDAASYRAAVGCDHPDLAVEARRLAKSAMVAGLGGVVCSPREIAEVRPVVGAGRIVVPGIRRPGDEAADQRRVAEPAAAVAAGATHLVVGRPITGADDPGAAYREFAAGLRR